MKFDDLLAQYLYENKTLRLLGLGRFTLEGKVSIPYEQDKEVYYPIEGLSFTHNSKEPLDDDLVAFLVKKLGKIQPLVRSDLESYLSNVKQFINLGKPYTIEGVGTLHLSNSGIYEFTPGNFLPVKEELYPHRENPEHNYQQKEKTTSAGKVFLVIIIILASLAALTGMGWGVYTLVVQNKPVEQREPPPVDSLISENTLQDTALLADAGIQLTDTADYKMIFEVTRLRSRAVNRTAYLHTLRINARFDSVGTGNDLQYRIFVNRTLAPTDTLRIKDSIARFFQRKVFIEKSK